MTETRNQLKPLIDQAKKSIFVEGYEATDEETLGIMVSAYFQWAGNRIVRCFLASLEDANFHEFRSQVEELARKEGLSIE